MCIHTSILTENRFRERANAKCGRYYDSISKTGVFNLSIQMEVEKTSPKPIEMDGNDILHFLLREGNYKLFLNICF